MSSPFQSTIQSREGVQIVRLSHGDDTLAEIAPALGANLFQLQVDGHHLLETTAFASFRAAPTRWGTPLLQPFVNRIKDGSFCFQGRRHHLATKQNGLVRGLSFELLKHGASQRDGAWAVCQLDSRKFPREILDQFPFPFVSTVTFRLIASGVEVVLEMENVGDTSMPASQGLHPYLLADPEATVRAPALGRCELVEMIPNGEVVSASGSFDLRRPRRVADLKLDDLYTDLAADADGRVRCHVINRQGATVIEFERRQFPYLMAYTPVARQAIALEPYSAPIDAFNLPAGEVPALAPGEKLSGTVRFLSQPATALQTDQFRQLGGQPAGRGHEHSVAEFDR